MITNLNEINQNLDPIDVLRLIGYEKSNPKRSGGEIRDYCPIHGGDNQRSLAINVENNVYCCHGECNDSGNLINLYAKAKKYGPSELPRAVEELASYFHLKIETSLPKNDRSKNNLPLSAEEAWNKAKEGKNHPYLKKKHVIPCPGLRYGSDVKGNDAIVVPFRDVRGDLKTVQYIHSGGKFFLSRAPVNGAFFTIGDVSQAHQVYIAEGLATSITVWEAGQKTVPTISCGSCSNVPHVVKEIKAKYQELEIIVCLDDNIAALKAARQVSHLPGISFRKPSFDGLPNPENEELADFNDIVSKCGQEISVVSEQLKTAYMLTGHELNDKEASKRLQDEPVKDTEDFFDRLGRIIGDHNFSLKLRDRNYECFEQEHKKLFTSGGLITGYDAFDKQVHFSKGDFITVQAMSNHGKSTLMLQLAYQFLINPKNRGKNPTCIFITYESTPLRIEEKLLNIISHERREGTILQYYKESEEKYLYPDRRDFRETIYLYNQLLNQRKIDLLKRIPLEHLEDVINLYKTEYPSRTLVLFLDYLQIIETSTTAEGWERIKTIAYKLESLAIEKEIIIFAACQVNEKRQTREGKDIYNASTINIDLFNHSHASLKSNSDLQKLYKEQINDKNVCTLSVFKQKHGPSFDLEDYLLFNGHNFEENKRDTKAKMKQGKFDDLT